MPRKDHLDDILRNWPYEPGAVSARLARGADGREVIQMRIDMGVLQMEVERRPDGARPGGAESYYDYLVALGVHEGDSLRLTDEQAGEVDRELMQYYHRRICWLALRDYERAVRDADHNLALMDFVRNCSDDSQWLLSHEQYRPFILYHRTQAAAMARLEKGNAEPAIEELATGLQAISDWFTNYATDEQFDDNEMVARLREMQDTIRERFGVEKTLHERLAEAIGREEYEQAALIRDEIARRDSGRTRRRRRSAP